VQEHSILEYLCVLITDNPHVNFYLSHSANVTKHWDTLIAVWTLCHI